MFISSLENFRTKLLENQSIICMAHLGPHAFPNISGQVVQVTMFSACPRPLPHYRGVYQRLLEGTSDEKERHLHSATKHTPMNADFGMIPGRPVAYWVSNQLRSAFSAGNSSPAFYFGQTTKTTKNSTYTRLWWESRIDEITERIRFRPFAKGGEARKWYGNREWVVRWDSQSRQHYKSGNNSRITPSNLWDKTGITWTDITSAVNTFRLLMSGDIPSTSGPSVYTDHDQSTRLLFLAFLNSKVASALLQVLNPTLHVNPQDVLNLPLPNAGCRSSANTASQQIAISKTDWDCFETSWDFRTLPVRNYEGPTLRQSQEAADRECLERFDRMKTLEEENNRVFIDAYGLQNELSPEVPDEQITLYRPNREEDIKRLVSYAIGCMMGRYSLGQPGLIYALDGDVGFDPSQYKTFPADPDGIVPVMEGDWFPDDASNRFVEFIGAAWPKDHLAANLQFVADSLGPAKGEESRDTIRRYLATGFYKHHLSMYKRRPIYWLFSSGKERAFQCLVYLHRYHEGTLARMRTEYVISLQGKLASRIDQLASDIEKATSASHGRKLEKEREMLVKQQAELQAYDEKLRHYAEMKIKLDLDDGVKVNYAKFGDLLAEVKAVTGGKDED
jgi:hypothetical protein